MPRKQYDTVAKQKHAIWTGALNTATKAGDEPLTQARAELWETWRKDPYAFLTGVDTDGTPILRTADERDDVSPVKPFPLDRRQLEYLARELWRGERIKIVNKARQLMVSTEIMLLALHYAIFVEEREIVVSKNVREEAEKLLKDKIRDVVKRMPLWIREKVGMSEEPKHIIRFANGSTITAVSANFADGGARGITASLVVVDEAAFQDALPSIMRAVLPMAVRVWLVSTPNLGNPGAKWMKDEVMNGRPDGRQE